MTRPKKPPASKRKSVDELARDLNMTRSNLYRQADKNPNAPAIKKFNKWWFEGLKKAKENTDSSYNDMLILLGLSDEEVLALKAQTGRVNQSLRAQIATAEKRRRGNENVEKAVALDAAGVKQKDIAAQMGVTTRAVRKMLQRAK
jgi:hypothetical protein